MTPIASLQNVIAVAQLQEVGVEVTFFRWMMVSVPFGVTCTIVSWSILLYLTKPFDVRRIPVVVYDTSAAAQSATSPRSLVVIVASLLVCIAFAGFSVFKPYFGDIGIIALCYIVFMFGSGLLTEVQ